MTGTNRANKPSADHDSPEIAAGCPLVARYLGATQDELRSVRGPARLAAMSDQQRLFPHQGTIELREEALLLEDWRSIRRDVIAKVELTFTDAYTRWMAGGARGGRYASFGLFGSLGKPLVLSLVDDGDRDDPIYLLIDFRWFSGINQARRWFPAISRWVEQGTSW